MKVFNQITDCSKKTAVALGFFDGVHTAHRKVISEAVLKKDDNTLSAVLTFNIDDKTPQNKLNVKTILTSKQKYEQIELLGIDLIYDLDFSKIADIEPEDFFYDILVSKLNVSFISCGYDYTFGKGAKGDVSLLKRLCDSNGVELSVVDKLSKDDKTFSSSEIREALTNGDIESANSLLGYNYYIKEKVLHGRRIGNTIGFPTINQSLDSFRVVLKYGVYHSTTIIDDKAYKSITNIGVKPTVGEEKTPLAETHVIGFDGDIYGKEVTVYFHKMQREEMKFANLGELKEAIARSVESRLSQVDF